MPFHKEEDLYKTQILRGIVEFGDWCPAALPLPAGKGAATFLVLA